MNEELPVEHRNSEYEMPQTPAQSRATWPLIVLLVAAAAVLFAMQSQRAEPPSAWVGRALPPLEGAGWLNSDGPLAVDELRGEVVLVDFWTSTCGPCLQHMPELVDFHNRFADRGVKIVGLTPEPAQAVERIERVVGTMDMTWPIGYDARLAFNALGVFATPTYVLYDRSGRSVWGGHSLNGLEDATVAALARD